MKLRDYLLPYTILYHDIALTVLVDNRFHPGSNIQYFRDKISGMNSPTCLENSPLYSLLNGIYTLVSERQNGTYNSLEI